MSRRGTSVVEVVIALCLLGLLMAGAVHGVHVLSVQARSSTRNLSQVQEALLLMETLRLELSSIVLNPMEDDREQEGISFLISKPAGNSIQFLSEKQEGGYPQRYLVQYQVKDLARPGAPPELSLEKTVWRFLQYSPWRTPILFPPGWPADWIGPVTERVPAERYRDLSIRDLRFQYHVPEEDEGRVFFRVKLLLGAPGKGRLMPFTTLVGVQTPEPPAGDVSCPCLFHPDFARTGCFSCKEER